MRLGSSVMTVERNEKRGAKAPLLIDYRGIS